MHEKTIMSCVTKYAKKSFRVNIRMQLFFLNMDILYPKGAVQQTADFKKKKKKMKKKTTTENDWLNVE